MTNPDHDHDHDHDHDARSDNDNGEYEYEYEYEEGAVAPAPAGGALASLAVLGTMLNNVNTAGILGSSGKPMLSFKKEGDGTWMFGRRRTIVEPGSSWAVNVLTFKWGYICFSDNNKVLGERLVSVSLPRPDLTELPDTGFPWVQQWSVDLKCLDGADAGAEVVYKPTTAGGIQAVVGLIEAARDRLNGGQHDGAVAPIVMLEKDSYDGQYGLVWIPLPRIVDWMPLTGPAPTPAPKPEPPPAPVEQPRRRRRVG